MTAPTVNATFGQLIGPWQVEQAVVTSLQKWLWPTYLEEVERQNGLDYGTLPKPGGDVYGAADLTSWAQDGMPAVMVVNDGPEQAPERLMSNGYAQAYRITAAVVLADDDEDVARRNASLYAAAMSGVMTQQLISDWPDLIYDVLETVAPSTELQDPDLQTEYTGQVSCLVHVCPMVNDQLGPLVPVAAEQSPANLPTVTQVPSVVVETDPLV